VLRRRHSLWLERLSALRVGVVLLGASIAPGCFLTDRGDCSSGEHRCQGGSQIQGCEAPCSDIGCTSSWGEVQDCNSGTTCLDLEGDARCVVSTTKEPRCGDGDGYCDGNTAVSCAAGYVTWRTDCGVAGMSAPDATPALACATNGSTWDCYLSSPLVPPAPVWCADAGAPACNAPSVCGPIVRPTQRTTARPTPRGGAIRDGVYVLTAANFYGNVSDTLVVEQASLTFEDGALSEVSYRDTRWQASGPYAVEGTKVSWTLTCEVNGVLNSAWFDFTAGESELRIYGPSAVPAVGAEEIWTLQ
jgi:hypothetical protein